MSLSLKETEDFLENKLQIPDWKKQLKESKFDFLFKLENRFKRVIYYENISWGIKAVKDMVPPSVEEVIDQCQVRGSGACLQLNWYLYLVLQNLGYDVFMAGCTTKTVVDPHSHCIIIARFPTVDPESVSPFGPQFNGFTLYMIDVGFARPAPSIINLNELPFSYMAGGFTVKHHYDKETNRVYRILCGGDPIRGEFESPDTENWDAYIDLIPRTFEHFIPVMTKIFARPDYTFFLNTFFMFRHTSVKDHSDFSYVSCLGRMLTTGTPHSREQQRFETYEELIPHLDKYFPEIGVERIKAVVAVYAERQKAYKARSDETVKL